MSTGIEWTDETWNVVTGCDRVSPGCDHCYIERTFPFREEGRRFDEHGKMGIRLHPDRLDKPLHWRKPRRVFVNSLSDLFHPDVPGDFIDRTFATMAACAAIGRGHHFQVLTKRPQRMTAYFNLDDRRERIASLASSRVEPGNAAGDYLTFGSSWPLPNVWLGTSVENQRYADLRIPHLLATPAAVRFLSVEPLLGPIEPRAEWLGRCAGCGEYVPLAEAEGDWHARADHAPGCYGGRECSRTCPVQVQCGPIGPRVDWVIVGGESGPGARPMHPEWARTIRDQCQTAGVPFFFKQWGEWHPDEGPSARDGRPHRYDPRTAHALALDGTLRPWFGRKPDGDEVGVRSVGKKAAGRELDGRTWNEMPTPAGVPA